MAEEKTALITGGEGDLAGHLREQLEGNGYRVLAPGRAEMDVRDSAQVAAYFKEHVERLDLLIANAGVLRDASFSRVDEAAWDEVVDSHLKGAFLVAQEALRIMARQRHGHLVFIGSRSGLVGPVGQTSYAAAKAGLVGLAKSLAAEYGKRGIRSNCVLPGFLDTKMTAKTLEKVGDQIRVEHVLGRLSSVEDAARFIVFLDSLEAVSGQVFQLDNRLNR